MGIDGFLETIFPAELCALRRRGGGAIREFGLNRS
jgi:hypothetical protein